MELISVAKEIIVQIKTLLDPTDIKRIIHHVSSDMKESIERSLQIIENGNWIQFGCDLLDAGESGLLLSSLFGVNRSVYLEDVYEECGKLDTAAREVWYEILNDIHKEVIKLDVGVT
jgi:hypothetical protein